MINPDHIEKDRVWVVIEHQSDTVAYPSGSVTCVQTFNSYDKAYKFAEKLIKENEKDLGFDDELNDADGFEFYDDSTYFYYDCWIEQHEIN